MMRSSFAGSTDEDEFGPNPFRTNTNDSDLLGPMAHQQQEQQRPMQQQPMQQQYPPPLQQQQLQYVQQPDPNSGMVGNFQPHQPGPPMQQQQPVYLSGQMDQRAGGPGANGGGNTPGYEIASTPFTWLNRCTSCFRIEGYLPYFDVDTRQVAERITAALIRFPQPDYFRTSIIGDESTNPGSTNPGDNAAGSGSGPRKGPDLYGPFWITMTLIFLIACTGNLSAYMHYAQNVHHAHGFAGHSTTSSSTTNNADLDSNSTMAPASKSSASSATAQEEELFEYDINHLLRAGSTLAIFAWAVPTMFWLACSCLGMPNISWSMWVCVYGYSMTPFLIAALVAWIPITILEWLVLAIATAASVLLIIRNLSTPLLQQDGIQQAKAAPILMSILGVHVVFLCVLKFVFFSG